MQSGNPVSSLNQTLSNIIAFTTIASIVITLIIVAFWIAAWIHRRKVQDAIIDIKTILTEMNERDKAREQPETPPVSTTPTDTETPPQ